MNSLLNIHELKVFKTKLGEHTEIASDTVYGI